jgi:hypothetical protein
MSAKHDHDEHDEASLPEEALSEDFSVVDALAEEARGRWLPVAPASDESRADADEAERKLFARIDAYEGKLKQRVLRRGDASFWGPVAMITAIAAGALLYAHARDAEHASSEAQHPHDVEPSSVVAVTSSTFASPEAPRPTAPAELAMVTGGGELQVDGVRADVKGANAGASIHDGNVVAARGGEAVFTAPGRVSWLLENGTELTSVRAGNHGGAIVLGLRSGAVEAQVTPVPNGEAFAVDIEGVRVAVHGTHLRVARETVNGETKVTVDLNEGVILVGAPPKAGSTVGTLVYTPAHVEFSVSDVEGTLQVDHDPAHVRAPVDPLSLSREPRDESVVLPSAAPPAPGAPVAAAPVAVGPRAPSMPAPKVKTANDAIMEAVRSCSDESLHGKTGSLTVSSMLTIDVKSDGMARIASFDPPIGPELQSCIGRTVYATRWSEPGAHRIPIEIHK